MKRGVLACACLTLGVLGGAAAQDWNRPEALDLIGRARARRASVSGPGGLREYSARAQGFVLFLAQFGARFTEPPRVVKADQLALEVYWRAPSLSKQRIIGRRDRVDLPTDIRYHRDHLGIVQNNFDDRMRLGDGHEVQDVLHPLAPAGTDMYDFAVVDSLSIRLPERSVRVYEVLVRPKDPNRATVVGSLFLDVEEAQVVRFRFTFTKAAYRDASVEDITVVLDNGLWDARFWLPRAQEIEIRRRTAWLDLPARGIIRARWEIDGYHFNEGIPAARFAGPQIADAPEAVRASHPWEGTIDEALVRAGEGGMVTLDEVRAELANIVSRQMLSGLAGARPGAGSFSDIVHFNRVEGLALGFGGVARLSGGELEMRGWGGYGLADRRLKAKLTVSRSTGHGTVEVFASRTVRDVGDDAVISPALNSLLSQELGDDFGDYYLLETVGVGSRWMLPGGGIGVRAAWDRVSSLDVTTIPAAGAFRPNAPWGDGRYLVLGGEVSLSADQLQGRRWVSGRLAVEVGSRTGGGAGYFRTVGQGTANVPVGRSEIRVSGWGGWGSVDLPRHRAFPLGGRGTLVGERFRAWGGRWAAWGGVEWQIPVPVPEVRLGSFSATGAELLVAPFARVGWVWTGIPGVPWEPTNGARPVVGAAVEWLHRLLRLEVGYSPNDRRVRGALDVRRDLWGIL